MIDLDALGGEEHKDKPNQVPVGGGELGLVISSKTVTDKKPPAAMSLVDVFARGKKLVYLIDRSGSMNEQVAGTSQVEYFVWSEETLKDIRDKAAAAAEKILCWDMAEAKFADSGDLDDSVFEGLELPSQDDRVWGSLYGLDEDAMKVMFLQKGLNKKTYLPYNYVAFQSGKKLDSRLALVTKMAEKMLFDRNAKYPDSSTEVIVFNQDCEILPHMSLQGLVTAIQAVTCEGGTSILRALRKAMEMCQHSPSEVGMHHFVLVTDGEDYGATGITQFVEPMKNLGVVLDFIYITNPGEFSGDGTDSVEAIKAAVKATGGTYTVVTSAEEFETKFVEASTRKLLPAGN